MNLAYLILILLIIYPTQTQPIDSFEQGELRANRKLHSDGSDVFSKWIPESRAKVDSCNGLAISIGIMGVRFINPHLGPFSEIMIHHADEFVVKCQDGSMAKYVVDITNEDQ